ncbi:MAG: Bug family tripartite tricarboxylate transporter substrate binding protein [Burkholderiales bacterium]
MHKLAPLLLLLCSTAVPAADVAPAYPDRPVRFIVLSPPGGGSDITARAIAQKLTEKWGQQVIVDTRAGAGGVVGMEIAANARPDGYTLVLGGIGPVAVAPSIYKKPPYDPVKDFTPIVRAANALNMLVVHPSVPATSVKELIAYGKTSNAKLNYGSSGAGRADHLAGEIFSKMTGVPMQHVPYKGGAPAMVDLLGGNIQLIFSTVSTAIVHVKAGKIRPLGMTAAKRSEFFPDIPTIAESGLPGFAVDNWYGVVAPAGLPRAIVVKQHRDISDTLNQRDVKERLAGLGIVAFPTATPEEFGAYIKSEVARYAKIVKEAGVTAE